MQLKKFGGNWKSNDDNYKKAFKSQRYSSSGTDPDLLCGVIFVDKGFTAKILFYLLSVCVQISFGNYKISYNDQSLNVNCS